MSGWCTPSWLSSLFSLPRLIREKNIPSSSGRLVRKKCPNALKSCTFPMRLLRLLTSLPCRMRVSTHPWNRNWDTKENTFPRWSVFIYIHLCSSMFHVHARQFADAFWPKSQTWRDISFISPPVLQTSASHLLAAQGPDLGVQKATNATGPDLGGSLGLIACFPQTLPAKKGDSMGWVNIKKKNTDLFLLFEPNFFWVSNSYPYSFLSLIDFKSCLIGSLWVPSEVQIPSSWVRALEDRF